MVLVAVLSAWWYLAQPPRPLPEFKEDRNVNWTNYAGTVSCFAPSFDSASGHGIIEGFFMHAARFNWGQCFVGFGMSTAPLCCEKGKVAGILSNRGLWGVNWIDTDKKLVEVQSGASISYISKKLAEVGLALEHQPSFTEISIGGALQTATHGYYPHAPSLSSSIETLNVYYSNYTSKTLSRTQASELFQTASAGLGAMGFIDTIVLRVVPLKKYARNDFSLPTSAILGNQAKIDELLENHPQWLSMQFSPLCDSTIIRTAAVQQGEDEGSLIGTYLTSPWTKHSMRFFQPLLKMSSVTSGTTTSGIMSGICAMMRFTTGNFVENQNRAVLVSRAAHAETLLEYYVKRSSLAAALRKVNEALLNAHNEGIINFNGFITVSFVAKEEDVTLAPNFRYDSAAIEISTHHQGHDEKVMQLVEAALAPFEPLPHLGLLNKLTTGELRARYGEERLKTFSRAAIKSDPKSKYLNYWKRRYYIGVNKDINEVRKPGLGLV